MEPATPPEAFTSTWRVQFHGGFALAEALALVRYWRAMGAGYLYASPLLQARSGSTHGYDVTDPTRLNPEIGGPEQFEALHRALRAAGIGLLLDIVPNHMAASLESPWWSDVLSHGRSSAQAEWFDIDWSRRRIVLPILGTQLTHAAAQRHIQLVSVSGGIRLRVYGEDYPLRPRSLARWLGDAVRQPELEQRLAAVNARPADLVRLAGEQVYALAYWRRANHEINYRRFFAINDLVGFRVERGEAFAAAHGLIHAWLREGKAQALRVDHIDGLHDPLEYLQRLEELFPLQETPGRILVEKILAPGEILPLDWPVAGATGYEFLYWLDRLQVPAAGFDALVRTYRRYLRRAVSFAEVVYGKKRQIMLTLFAGEMLGFGRRLAALAAASATAPPALAEPAMAEAVLIELAACFDVYRTYARALASSAADRERIAAAAAAASARHPGQDAAAFHWAAQLLSCLPAAGLPPEAEAEWRALVARWQQYTGPIQAKGHEDSALYVYFPLASLNEVGGDPGRGGVAVEEFHRRMRIRQRMMPGSLNATSTHDTKRSEDVRARLHVLAEIPREWRRHLLQWTRWNAPWRTLLRRRPVPDRNTEYLLYQTLLGAWPLELLEATPAPGLRDAFRERIRAYMLKAAREAKVATRWSEPNQAWEEALSQFLDRIFHPGAAGEFFAGIGALARRVAPAGALNSLVQVMLKSTAPGVPDFYQGCELWDFSLVDPDNRRPVDYGLRQALLRANAGDAQGRQALAHWQDGGVKQWLIRRLLHYRRAHPELFAEGEYQPLAVAGPRAGRAIAFLRRHRGEAVLAVAPLHVAAFTLGGSPDLADFPWRGTALQLASGLPVRWRHAWDGREIEAVHGRLPLAGLLGPFPVSLWEAA